MSPVQAACHTLMVSASSPSDAAVCAISSAIVMPVCSCGRLSLHVTSLITKSMCILNNIPRLHYQPVSSRFSSCALTSPVSTSVCVYITTARTGLNQRQLVRLFHSTVAGSREVPKHVRACS